MAVKRTENRLIYLCVITESFLYDGNGYLSNPAFHSGDLKFIKPSK